jgi:predicted ribosomally synthesized peptide with SipW-like signal peptide
MGVLRSKWALVVTMGVAALGLVGLGASASFSDSVAATQVINTGTFCLNISSVDRNGNPDGAVTSNGHQVTFKLTNSGSHIDEVHWLTVKNCGTLGLDITSVVVSAQGGGLDPAPLGNDVFENINGFRYPVRTAESFGWTCSGCQLHSGQSLAPFIFAFDANLGNADQGQTITPTITLGATEWDGAKSTGSGGVQIQS